MFLSNRKGMVAPTTSVVAVVFRGVCSSHYVDSKDMSTYRVSYQDSVKSLRKHLFDINPNTRFDVFGLGWADTPCNSEVKTTFESIPNVHATDIVVRPQIDFRPQFEETIGDFQHVLKSIFAFRQNAPYEPTNIHTRDHFQNQFSYAYSMATAANLVPQHPYDAYVSLRWDIELHTPIRVDQLEFSEQKHKLFINTQPAHSPVFLGDFLVISKTNLFKTFFEFYKQILRQSGQHAPDIEVWMKHCVDCAHLHSPGSRYSLSCYTHQAILAYFLHCNGIPYPAINHSIRCSLNKSKVI